MTNKIDKLTKVILESDKLFHYILVKDQELILSTDIDECQNYIENLNYKPIGCFAKTSKVNNPIYIKNELNKIIKNI